MPTIKVKTKAGKAAAAKSKVKVSTKAAKPKASAKATKAKPATKATATRSKADHSVQRATVRKMTAKGAKLSEIATALKTTPGIAAMRQMENAVEDNPRLRIKGRAEEDVVKNVIIERNKQNEHSGWGWLSARSGINEGRLKKLAEEAGLKVKGSHIAKERREAREGSAKPARKAAAKAGSKGNAAKAAKAKTSATKAKRGGKDPSKRV